MQFDPAAVVTRMGKYWNTILHARQANSLVGSARNISAHYDLSNEMFRLFLSHDMTYSAGIFDEEVETLRKQAGERDFLIPHSSRKQIDFLELAQYKKLDRILDQLQVSRYVQHLHFRWKMSYFPLQLTYKCPLRAMQIAKALTKLSSGRNVSITPLSDDHVLEIGCGWGSMAIRAVSRFPGLKWTAITISEEQLALATERVQAAGLANAIQVVLCDYRKAAEKFGPKSFSKVVSIEMIEAVGHEFQPGYFAAIDECLMSGGISCFCPTYRDICTRTQ